jgi:ribosome-associated protein
MKETDDTSSQRPSKSVRKREVSALQEIGETLVNLPAPQLAKITLEPRLAEAIATARSLKSHEAKRRQLQYIGKLMRHVDIQPIQDALNKIMSKDQQGKAQFHQIERWRDKLISEGDKILDEFLQQYSHADRQYLRQLVRRAQKDQADDKKTGASLELFRYLRELIEI